MNPTGNQTVVQPPLTALTLNQLNANGVLNATTVTVSGVTNPDIGQQITQAFLNLQSGATNGNVGTVYIPSGNYTYSHDINVYIGTNTGAYRQTLLCDPGATLSYTGTGNALLALPTPNNTNVNGAQFRIIGCNFSGTSSAANGLHFQSFYGIYLQNNLVFKFTNRGAAGFLFDGAGICTAVGNVAFGNTNGVVTQGNATSSQAANAITWIGGLFQANKDWGWFDSSIAHASAGYDYNDTIFGATFEGNGTASVQSGDVSVQNVRNFLMQSNYAESNVGRNQIMVDGREVPIGLVRIIGNELDNPTSSTILAAGTVANLDVEGNNVQVPGSSFVNAISSTVNTYEANNIVAVGNAGVGAFENLAKASATPPLGQVSCIFSAVQSVATRIGHCTNAVSSTGGCSCAP